MTKAPEEPRAEYYREAATWANDRQGALVASRRVAWMVAAGFGVVAVLEAVAIAALFPLKTVVPYTLLVDRHTGFVEALQPLDAAKITPDAALTQSFLVQYVIAREGFSIGELQSDYHKVSLWSAGEAQAKYVAHMQGSSPDSPLTLYPRSSTVNVRVRSVSALNADTSMVRFETQREDADGQRQPAQGWVAVIHYRFSTAAMSREDRFLNPLGFQVVDYRLNAETAPSPPAMSAPAEAAGLLAPSDAGSAPASSTPRQP